MASEIIGISSFLDIAEADDNQQVLLKVVALHEVSASSRSLYVVQTDGQEIFYDQVLEVYFYNKNWPTIKKGDVLELAGQIKKVSTGPRLKISQAGQIYQTGFNLSLTKPESLDLAGLAEELLGSYITTSGTVVKKNGKNIYLANDGEEDPLVRVYLDFDYKDLQINKGSEMIVSGILQPSSAGLKLLVKDKEDILLSQQVLGYQEESKGLNTSTQYITDINRQYNIRNILYVLLVLATMAGLVYWLKNKRKSRKSF